MKAASSTRSQDLHASPFQVFKTVSHLEEFKYHKSSRAMDSKEQSVGIECLLISDEVSGFLV